MTTVAKQFCRAYLDGAVSRRYLFGVNEYSSELARHFEIAGYIDDFFPGQQFNGKPVIGLDQVPEGAMVVSTLLGRPLTGKRILDDHGLSHLDFFGFYQHSGLNLPTVRFWKDYSADMDEQSEQYDWVGSILADEDSRETFRKIRTLRETGVLDHMKGFTDRQDEQYFEKFLTYRPGEEVFVDAGCFDGQTSLEFIQHCSEYRKIFAFEPDVANLETVRRKLAHLRDVEVMKLGLAAERGTARISQAGSASRIDESGTEVIRLAPLDEVVSERVTFIKIDVEGAEEGVIAGAKNIIARDQPKIAVAVYHHPEDIWSIPRQVMAINPGYRVRLRHYTEGVVETIMYFTMPRPSE